MKCNSGNLIFPIALMVLFFIPSVSNAEGISHRQAPAKSNPVFVGSAVAANKHLGRRYSGKPHAPVELSYLLQKSIQTGESALLKIKLINTQDTDNFKAKLRLSKGLQSNNMQARYDFGVLAKNSSSQILVELSSDYPGLFYVYINAGSRNGGQYQSRSFSIPIKIGNVNAKTSLKPSGGRVFIDSTGARIISMQGKAVKSAASQ